jgi:hypothetical protein
LGYLDWAFVSGNIEMPVLSTTAPAQWRAA